MQRHIIINAALLACFWLLPVCAEAQTVVLHPTLELTQEDTANRLSAKHSQTFIFEEHGGGMLSVSYTSSEPLYLDIAPIKTKDIFTPEDLMHVTLAAGQNARVMIDVTESTGWSPWKSRYYIGLFGNGNDKDNGAINEIHMQPADAMQILHAFFAHLLRGPDFEVALPHYVHAHRVFGISTVLIGTLILLTVAGIVFFRSSKEKRLRNILCVSVGLMTVVGLLNDMDLLRFSAMNLQNWNAKHTYGIAGSAFEVADVLRASVPEKEGILVCTKSTDYVTKILRYQLYPRRVSLKPEEMASAKVIYVKDSPGWSFDGTTLKCGNIEGPAKKIRDFRDGSALFSVGLASS